MSFHFEIKRVKSDSIAKYDFKLNFFTPDYDDCSENLNAHYFTFTV